MILFVPLTAVIFSRLLWFDCVSFFLDTVFFLWFLLVVQLFCILFFLFLTSSFVKDSSVMMLSDFPVLLSLSSSSSVVEKTSKRLLQFILDVSVLLPCLRGPFNTVLNVSSTSNTFFRLQTIYLNILDFFISNCIMVFFDQLSCNKLSVCWQRMLLISFNLLTSEEMSLFL